MNEKWISTQRGDLQNQTISWGRKRIVLPKMSMPRTHVCYFMLQRGHCLNKVQLAMDHGYKLVLGGKMSLRGLIVES